METQDDKVLPKSVFYRRQRRALNLAGLSLSLALLTTTFLNVLQTPTTIFLNALPGKLIKCKLFGWQKHIYSMFMSSA